MADHKKLGSSSVHRLYEQNQPLRSAAKGTQTGIEADVMEVEAAVVGSISSEL